MEPVVIKERELWPDIIRIFAIYGVITLHTLSAYNSFLLPHFSKLFQTSVPLFVMLSGALLIGKTESYYTFFKKRSLKVLIPWVFWTIIYMILFYLVKDKYVFSTYFKHNSIGLENWVRFFIIQFFTGLWFLPLIFGIYLITPAIRLFIKNAKQTDILYILVLWFVFISLLPWIIPNSLFPNWLPLYIYAPIQYSGYFILGYLLIHKGRGRFSNLPLWYLVPLLALIFILPISSFIEPATVLGTSLIFIYLFSFSIKLENKIDIRLRNLIHEISGATLGIYVVHSLIIYLLNRNNVLLSKINFNIFYTLLIFITSLLIVLIIQKIKFLKNIVP